MEVGKQKLRSLHAAQRDGGGGGGGGDGGRVRIMRLLFIISIPSPLKIRHISALSHLGAVNWLAAL